MGSLGTYLRELREARGESLEAMAHSTRVGKRQLEALEEEEFSELPAPVFVKGFIRAYCEFLGVAPEEALGRYRQILGELARLAASSSRSIPRASRASGPIVLSLVLLIVLGLALLALNVALKGGAPPPPQQPGPAAQPDQPAGSPPATGATREAPTPSSGAVAAPRVVPDRGVAQAPVAKQRLVVKAVEATWIRVQMDNGEVAQELLPPGATREWSAEKRFVLTVGNAGGIEIELNGRPIPRLGSRGAVIHRLVLPQEGPTPRS